MRTVHGTKADARRAIEQYRLELESGTTVNPNRITVGGYARAFHDMRVKIGQLSPLSLDRENIEIKLIEELFGDTPIDRLTSGQINEAYAKLRDERHSSLNQIYKLHSKLSQIMSQAMREDIVLKSPCDQIAISAPEPKERRSLSAEQAIKLAQDLRDAPKSGKTVAVWLALATGMRRGEILGLSWDDVDFEKKRIRVSKQYAKDRVRRKPKTKTSIRSISIDGGTVSFLEDWRDQLLEQFGKIGTGGVKVLPSEFPVCPNELGGWQQPDNFDRWRRAWFVQHGLGRWKKEEKWVDSRGITRTKQTGYDGFCLHELRHTQATLLIGSGADIKTIQHRLGHSRASVTLDCYSHWLEENDEDAAGAIGCLLSGREFPE